MKRYLDSLIDSAGNAISGATITVYNTSTLVKPTIYSDSGVTPIANPVSSDASGRFSFYVADGRYDLAFAGSGITPFSLSDIEVADITGSSSTSDLPWKPNVVQLPDGSAGAPSLCFANATNTGIIRESANMVIVVTGTRYWYYDTSGNLLAYTDGVSDIGSSAANRPRNIYVSNQLVSKVATGTAPIAVDSTTEIANANVGTLKGCVLSAGPLAAGYVPYSSSTTQGTWQKGIKVLDVQSTPVVVSNNAAETLLMAVTIPASEFTAANQAIRIKGQGSLANTSGGAVNYTFQLKDSTAVTTWVTSAVTSVPNTSTFHWKLDAEVICVTTGSPGTVEVQGGVVIGGTEVSVTANTATISYDTAAQHVLQFKITMGTASANASGTQRTSITERLG